MQHFLVFSVCLLILCVFSIRKPQQDDEDLSAEACRLISGLPNLSFMQAKVFMFPSILLPKE